MIWLASSFDSNGNASYSLASLVIGYRDDDDNGDNGDGDDNDDDSRFIDIGVSRSSNLFLGDDGDIGELISTRCCNDDCTCEDDDDDSMKLI